MARVCEILSGSHREKLLEALDQYMDNNNVQIHGFSTAINDDGDTEHYVLISWEMEKS